ncbi:MAG TPA: endolytic transglycosylase MltG, partial [Phaeodactylibacter sp.]|nr:endolytic transglycosylase MltG [Phaeodactylibacter sp.]
MQLAHNQEFINKLGFKKETLISLFIPNTYEFFWNTNAKQFFEKMKKEQGIFWKKNNREKKAADLNMTKAEVYTLASIVERETNQNDEKKRIAGVYLNRLKKGILLQADPTVVFATRDFAARRVLNRHINFDSPYNTYKYAGLPPGPISMASISSIDAVLNAEKHSYLYFCAKPDNSGHHAFAKTLAGHNRNANKFRNWLNKQRIMR